MLFNLYAQYRPTICFRNLQEKHLQRTPQAQLPHISLTQNLFESFENHFSLEF